MSTDISPGGLLSFERDKENGGEDEASTGLFAALVAVIPNLNS